MRKTDEIDIAIIQQLRMNSRMPYRELAKATNLSINAVHKRIKDIVETGIIPEFHTGIVYNETELVGAVIIGRSQSPDIETVMNRMNKNDRIAQIVIAGGNYLYVVGYLRELNELDKFSRSVIKDAMLSDPIVGIGIDNTETGSSEKITTLDYKIALALRSDSRKDMSDVAQELNVASKTIHRRLARMVEKKQIFFSIDVDWAASNDIITIFHMNLKESANREDAIATLTNKYKPNFLNTTVFSNIQDMFLATIWTKSMKELKEIQGRLEKSGYYKSIMPNISYSVHSFETWMGKWLKDKAYPKE